MWSDTFVLAARMKGPLLAWTAGMIVAATAVDQMEAAQATTLPMSILGVVAQTYIVTAGLRVGLGAEAQAAIRPNFARVLGIGLLSGIAMLLGGLLLIIPGVFLLIRWWVAVPVALDRNISVTEALRDSWQLTASHWAPILGLFLGLLAMLVVPMFGLGVYGGLDDEGVSLLASLVANIVAYGVTFIGTVSTVAVYRAISDRTTDLRAVFE